MLESTDLSIRELTNQEKSLVYVSLHFFYELMEVADRVAESVKKANEEFGIPDAEAYENIRIAKDKFQEGVRALELAITRPNKD